MFHVVLILFVLVYDVFILALCADFSVIKKADYFVRNFCYFSFDEGHTDRTYRYNEAVVSTCS